MAGPSAYEELHAACTTFRDGHPADDVAAAVERFAQAPPSPSAPVPRAELVEELRRDVERLRRREAEPTGRQE